MQTGIVGLPNVGKSTLFNALTSSAQAQAANYPFCTIEPNIGNVWVPDPRLDRLQQLAGSESKIPTQLRFVDIAGLVKGASSGEGLGNQFLSHIRSVDAIIHLTRCFQDDNILHVHDRIDPIEDIEIIETELMMADLQSLQQRLHKAKVGTPIALMQKLSNILSQGGWLSEHVHQDPEIEMLHLLTTKPVMHVANVSEKLMDWLYQTPQGQDWRASPTCPSNPETDLEKEKKALFQMIQWTQEKKRPLLILSAALESEMQNLDVIQRAELLQAFGWQSSGLDQIIQTAYEMLNLITFFTVGPKEARAWTVAKGALAPEAAGVIHTDFQKGFIRAETVGFHDFCKSQSWSKAKEDGKLRVEGRDYVVQDGDIFLFRFNV